MTKDEFCPGDRVRIIQNRRPLRLGPTLWEITEADRFIIWMREAGTNYKPQQFDASLVMKVSQ
jgi:hypothetical protein